VLHEGQEVAYYGFTDDLGDADPDAPDFYLQPSEVPWAGIAVLVETAMFRLSRDHHVPEAVLVLRDLGCMRLSATDMINLKGMFRTTDLRGLVGKAVKIRREDAYVDGVRKELVRISEPVPSGSVVPRYDWNGISNQWLAKT
jgi:hypothetical protein